MKDLKNATLKLKGDLTLVSVEDSGALLDVVERCYYNLNATAFFLLKLMEEGCHYENLKAELVSEFNIDKERGRRDVASFVKELSRLAIIQAAETAGKILSTDKIKEGNKKYETPLIEYASELAVACAPAPPITV